MARIKYEVVPFDSGTGFFIHGGTLGGMFIEDEADAKLMAEALNHAELLKLNTTMTRVNDALYALEQLTQALNTDTSAR